MTVGPSRWRLKPKPLTCCSGGFTLPEILAASAVVGIVFLAIASFVRVSSKGILKQNKQLVAQEQMRITLDALQRDFLEMNEIVAISVAAPNPSITFIMDSNRLPGYNPDQINPVDGLDRRFSPDQDGDAWQLGTSPDEVRLTGNDLDDDDDDGDGRIDVLCRYRKDGTRLVREFAYNAITQVNAGTLAGVVWEEVPFPKPRPENIEELRFEVFSSWDYLRISNLLTVDTNNDTIIPLAEIAALPAAQGGGASLLALDSPGELNLINMINVVINVNLGDRGGTASGSLQINPPLLPVKRKV